MINATGGRIAAVNMPHVGIASSARQLATRGWPADEQLSGELTTDTAGSHSYDAWQIQTSGWVDLDGLDWLVVSGEYQDCGAVECLQASVTNDVVVVVVFVVILSLMGLTISACVCLAKRTTTKRKTKLRNVTIQRDDYQMRLSKNEEQVTELQKQLEESNSRLTMGWDESLKRACLKGDDEQKEVMSQFLDKKYPQRWELNKCIGGGSFGTVLSAHDNRLGDVAIKFSFTKPGRTPRSKERLMREAVLLRRVHHRNVCHLHEAHTDDDSDLCVLIMELLRGDLRSEIDKSVDKRLDPYDATTMTLHVLCGLLCVHDLGVAHRDIKPDNIAHTKDRLGRDVYKLIDFSISAYMFEEDEDTVSDLLRTSTQSINAEVGSSWYLAPEQITGKARPEAKSDLWSLSVVLFEALVGERPFGHIHSDSLTSRKIIESAIMDVADGVQPVPQLVDVYCKNEGKAPPPAVERMQKFVGQALSPETRFERAEEMYAALHLSMDHQRSAHSGADGYGVFISYRVAHSTKFADELYAAASKTQVRRRHCGAILY